MLRAAAALAGAALLSGCVAAAAIPLAAGGLIARNEMRGDGQRKAPKRKGAAAPADARPQTAQAREWMERFEGRQLRPVEGTLPPPSGPASPVSAIDSAMPGKVVMTGLTALPAPGSPPVSPPAAETAAISAESAAFSLQAYQALWSYLAAKAAARAAGTPLSSVVLAAGSSFDAPSFVPCGAKPLAVIFDLDETPTSNPAMPSRDPDARWRRWRGDGSDLLVAAPGAADGIAAARREGLTVIFSSGRSPESAPAVLGVLAQLGFGRAELGKTLYLRGGSDRFEADDAVRQAIASHYCVVAIVGDSLGEFSDLFDPLTPAGDTRRNAATETMLAPLWGAGWFMLPNPVYATGRSETAAEPMPGDAPKTAGVK